MTREQLEQELIDKHGYRIGYVLGHGCGEGASSADVIIADLEKTDVLIRPEDIFEKPVPMNEWF